MKGIKTGGRKKGTPNKLTVAIRAVAVASADAAGAGGLSMLEIMEGNARYFLQQALDAEAVLATIEPDGVLEPEDQFKAILAKVKNAAGLRSLAGEAAKDAAPFRHARLAAIEHTGKDGGPIETSEVSDLEAARKVAFLLARAMQQTKDETHD